MYSATMFDLPAGKSHDDPEPLHLFLVTFLETQMMIKKFNDRMLSTNKLPRG